MAFVVFLRGAGGAYFAPFVRQLTDVRPRRMAAPKRPRMRTPQKAAGLLPQSIVRRDYGQLRAFVEILRR